MARQRSRLNPYSNGMKIERICSRDPVFYMGCLNPYSNGMKIEQSYLLGLQLSVLLVYLSYDLYSQSLKALSANFSQMPIIFRVKCRSFNRLYFTIC